METHAENPLKLVYAIIPARYSSVRLPGKMLLPIAGKPLILHTVDRACEASSVDEVIVATDDQRIFDVVVAAGHRAVMTSIEHQSGSDRIAEVAAGLPYGSIVVNVQGDEPLISPKTIDAAVMAMTGGNDFGLAADLPPPIRPEGLTAPPLEGGESFAVATHLRFDRGRVSDGKPDIVTTYEPLSSVQELENPNIVKIVATEDGRALYFSRSPMPFPREASNRHGGPQNGLMEEPQLFANYKKHTGLYVYRREYVLKFTQLPQTTLEKLEMLEQLRALENGAFIKVIRAESSSIGVDTEEDLEFVRQMIEGRQN